MVEVTLEQTLQVLTYIKTKLAENEEL